MDKSVEKYLEDMLQAISDIGVAENRFGRHMMFLKMTWFSAN